jgi:hypothetical protein
MMLELCQMPLDLPQMPLESRQMPVELCQMPLESRQIATYWRERSPLGKIQYSEALLAEGWA